MSLVISQKILLEDFMSNTDRRYKHEQYEDAWEVPRRQSYAKVKNDVEVTGKTYTEKYVVENNLLDDFVLTRDAICSILQLADQTVDTYVMPKLDIAYAEKTIRKHIERPKIQVVISKKSLMNFINTYVNCVEEKQEIYSIEKLDYNEIDMNGEYSVKEELINFITINVYEKYKNRRYIQQFLDYATDYIENHIYHDFETNLLEDRDKVVNIINETIENDILTNLKSYRSIKTELKYKHSMQARRYIEDTSHYQIKVNPLEPGSKDKKDIVRFVLYPSVYLDSREGAAITEKSDIDKKRFYSLTVKTKTIEYLNAVNSDDDIVTMVLAVIKDNYDEIASKYSEYLDRKKS